MATAGSDSLRSMCQPICCKQHHLLPQSQAVLMRRIKKNMLHASHAPFTGIFLQAPFWLATALIRPACFFSLQHALSSNPPDGAPFNLAVALPRCQEVAFPRQNANAWDFRALTGPRDLHETGLCQLAAAQQVIRT